jgi:hypothetical protein
MIGHALERPERKKGSAPGTGLQYGWLAERRLIARHGVSSLFRLRHGVRPVPEILAIAGRRFCILIDSNQDRFDVVIAPTFMHAHVPDFGKGIQKCGIVLRVTVMPLKRFVRHLAFSES